MTSRRSVVDGNPHDHYRQLELSVSDLTEGKRG